MAKACLLTQRARILDPQLLTKACEHCWSITPLPMTPELIESKLQLSVYSNCEGEFMESGDLLNYTATAALIGGMLKKPLIALAVGIPAWLIARKMTRSVKAKRKRLAEGISDASRASKNMFEKAQATAVPAAKEAIIAGASRVGPLIAQAPGAAKIVAQQSFETAQIAVAKAAPHVQNAARAAAAGATAAAVKAAPILEGAASKAAESLAAGADVASELAAKNAPVIRETAMGLLSSIRRHVKSKQDGQ
jgi:hypothetical protein